MSGGARAQTLRYLLEREEEIVSVITPQLTAENDRFSEVILTAVEFGVPVIPVTKDNLENIILNIKFDILISCGFPYLLNKKIITHAKYAINVHPTLLPKYRGFRSGPFILMNDERMSGVTVHFLSERMDQGDIILQTEFPLTPFDTTKSVSRKCKEIEPEIVHTTLQQIKENNYTAIPQNEEEATEYTKIRTPDDSEINWNKSLKDLYNEIRACDPLDYPAFFYIDGQKVCIKLWRPDKSPEEQDMI